MKKYDKIELEIVLLDCIAGDIITTSPDTEVDVDDWFNTNDANYDNYETR